MVQKTSSQSVDLSKGRPSIAWSLFQMSRLPFTIEAVLRVTCGALLYHLDHPGENWNWRRWFLAASVVQLTNIAVNYYNLYADYEADLYQWKSGQMGEKHAPILVTGALPKWSALAAACVTYGLVACIILGDRILNPDTTPFVGQTLFANCIAIFLATQYNGYFNTSHTFMCEVNTLADLYLGTFLCGYNLQRSSGWESFIVPVRSFPLMILDHILGYTRLLVMNVVDIEADLTINKVTMAGLLGKARTAQIYTYGQYLLAVAAVYLAYVAQDSLMRQLILSMAFVVLPQTLVIARDLRHFAAGDESKRAMPPIQVSLLELQVLVLWSAQIAYAIRP